MGADEVSAGDGESFGEEESGGDTDNGRGLFLTSSFSLDSAEGREEWAERSGETATGGCGIHTHLTPHYQLE